MAEFTPKADNIRAINILHKALFLGQIIFAAISAFLVYGSIFKSTLQDIDKILEGTALILSVSGFIIGSSIFNKKLAEARGSEADWKSKFETYRAASILRWAMMEGPCLFTIICFLLTGAYPLLALAVIFILIFFRLAPSKTKIAEQLELDEQEMVELQG